MEKRKMKLWKKILIVILIIFIILSIFVIYRYNVLSNIYQKNNEKFSASNYYYYSKTDDTIMEVWKKDQITKVILKQVNGEGDITIWKDEGTGEEYTLYNKQKIYTESQGAVLGIIPSGFAIIPDISSRILVALNPMTYIGKKEYDNKECYYVKIDKQEELIEKETGLIIYSNSELGERNINYRFNNITDEEVEKPDIEEYKNM